MVRHAKTASIPQNVGITLDAPHHVEVFRLLLVQDAVKECCANACTCSRTQTGITNPRFAHPFPLFPAEDVEATKCAYYGLYQRHVGHALPAARPCIYSGETVFSRDNLSGLLTSYTTFSSVALNTMRVHSWLQYSDLP